MTRWPREEHRRKYVMATAESTSMQILSSDSEPSPRTPPLSIGQPTVLLPVQVVGERRYTTTPYSYDDDDDASSRGKTPNPSATVGGLIEAGDDAAQQQCASLGPRTPIRSRDGRTARPVRLATRELTWRPSSTGARDRAPPARVGLVLLLVGEGGIEMDGGRRGHAPNRKQGGARMTDSVIGLPPCGAVLCSGRVKSGVRHGLEPRMWGACTGRWWARWNEHVRTGETVITLRLTSSCAWVSLIKKNKAKEWDCSSCLNLKL